VGCASRDTENNKNAPNAMRYPNRYIIVSIIVSIVGLIVGLIVIFVGGKGFAWPCSYNHFSSLVFRNRRIFPPLD
jgi:hypothetical protein